MTDLDADDVLALMAAAHRALTDWLADGTGTIESRLRLYAVLSDAAGNFGTMAQARTALGQSIVADMDGPAVVDGRVWTPKRKLSKREPDNEWLRSQVSRLAVQAKVDESTGEERDPTPAEVMERVWVLAEPAKARTAQFAKVGIDLDQAWGIREWTDVLEEER